MFGSLGVPELLLIFVVVLIVFGPRKIPEIGRTLGKALGEFRRATDELKNSIEHEVRLEELKQIAPAIITPAESVSRSEPPSQVTSVHAEAAAPGEDEVLPLPQDAADSLDPGEDTAEAPPRVPGTYARSGQAG